MRITILTLFPEYFESALKSSILGRACANQLLDVSFVNLRDFGEGKYKAVDDKQFGGGPGMVLMPTVVEKAFEAISDDAAKPAHVIYLSPQGKKLTAAKAAELSKLPSLTLLCGHYEGVDERAIEEYVDEEISIGDYILTGGEPAALVLLDSVSRFIPGVVGEADSVEMDTFESAPELYPGGLKYPVYTRPQSWHGREVPPVLLSGNHGSIAKWRRTESEARTRKRRPDLI